MSHETEEPREAIGIFQGDIIIKTAIELSLEDMRANPWVIEDVFASLVENPLLKQKYGLKEVARAKEFILNNDIPIFMHHRLDKVEFPCITIAIGTSTEDKSLATLGDASPFFEDYEPSEIGKPIKYLIPPFTPVSFDQSTGIIEVPEDIVEYRYIDEGMIAVDPETGEGYIIQGKAGTNGFQIEAGLPLNGDKLAIIPRYATYRARRECARSQETYNIGCHVEGDPSTLIFLYSVVKYSLYRYREALLEHENFQLSKLSSSELIKNQSFDIENVYSRFITLQGQIEESWVKSPLRFIEAVDLIERPEEDEDTLQPGIKILSKNQPEDPDECDLWITIDEE